MNKCHNTHLISIQEITRVTEEKKNADERKQAVLESEREKAGDKLEFEKSVRS
jgi:hypothetical protein